MWARRSTAKSGIDPRVGTGQSSGSGRNCGRKCSPQGIASGRQNAANLPWNRQAEGKVLRNRTNRLTGPTPVVLTGRWLPPRQAARQVRQEGETAPRDLVKVSAGADRVRCDEHHDASSAPGCHGTRIARSGITVARWTAEPGQVRKRTGLSDGKDAVQTIVGLAAMPAPFILRPDFLRSRPIGNLRRDQSLIRNSPKSEFRCGTGPPRNAVSDQTLSQRWQRAADSHRQLPVLTSRGE